MSASQNVSVNVNLPSRTTNPNDLDGVHKLLYQWIHANTTTEDNRCRPPTSLVEEIINLTPHIKLDKKRRTVESYIRSIHKQLSSEATLLKQSVNTVTELENIISTITQPTESDIEVIHDSKTKLGTILHSCKLIKVNIETRLITLAAQKNPRTVIETVEYDCNLNCASALYKLFSYSVCSVGESSACSVVVSSNTRSGVCARCRSITRKRKSAEEKTTREDTLDELKTVSPGFYNHVVNQLERSKQTKKPYDKRTKDDCLQLYVRDKRSYDNLRATNTFGVLPHPSVLKRYKNTVPQYTGMNRDLLTWMDQEARSKMVTDNGRRGGLIFDEMTIQAEVTRSSRENKEIFYGFRDHGQHLENLSTCYGSPSTDREKLPDKVLQVLFSGLTGFKFPVAHYPVSKMNSRELRSLLDETITALDTCNFQVIYIMMDGASVNRTLIKQVQRWFGSFSAPNLNRDGETITYIMDPKHTIKKMRNSLSDSGGEKRTVTSTTGIIVWDYWRRLFRWSEDSIVSLSKLTVDHINPKGTFKMRNSLAEQCLDRDLLDSMKLYQKSLCKPEELDATIELLDHSAKLVQLFQDRTSIVAKSDSRLTELKAAGLYFQQYLGKDKKLSFTDQTSYDIICTIRGLLELTDTCLSKNIPIVPGFLNSDVIENHFSMVRGLYNGSSDHPNYFTYKSLQNSIILTQRVGLPNKRNADSSSEQHLRPPQ